MRKLYCCFRAIFIAMIASVNTMHAQVSVNLHQELDAGRIYTGCVITGTKGGKIYFTTANGDTLSAKLKSRKEQKDPYKPMSGTRPSMGDTVVMVLREKQVTLCARVYDSLYYRFWNPIRAPSFFVYKRPGQCLPGKEEFIKPDNYDDYFSCADGCLYPKSLLEGATTGNVQLEGPTDIHLKSIKPFGVKISWWEPAIGFEMKISPRVSLSSMTLLHVLHGHNHDNPVLYHSYQPYMTTGLRYYFYALPCLPVLPEGSKTRFSGLYASVEHTHSFNPEDVHLDALGIRLGTQRVAFRYFFIDTHTGYITNFHNLRRFNFGMAIGVYL